VIEGRLACEVRAGIPIAIGRKDSAARRECPKRNDKSLMIFDFSTQFKL
jgi:hypothetical protein